MPRKLTFFPVGNGDTSLIEFDGVTIVTDVNYRQAAEDDTEDAYDIRPDLLKAAIDAGNANCISVFVLTHPDQDHLGGFCRIFYCGDPADFDNRGGDAGDLIINELWVSPHSVNPNYETDASKPVFAEMRRRLALSGTAQANADGNRIRVLDTENNSDLLIGASIQATTVAPTADEANIEKAVAGAPRNSTNNSSLVIRWLFTVDGGTCSALLGGDAEMPVWERLYHQHGVDPLRRHILLAPHHCSMTAFGEKDENGEYVVSPYANAVLSSFDGAGFVVASSKKILDDDNNPPHWEARRRYLEILNGQGGGDAETRFLNPETHSGGSPAPVVFELTGAGPSLKIADKSSGPAIIAGSALGKPSRYG